MGVVQRIKQTMEDVETSECQGVGAESKRRGTDIMASLIILQQLRETINRPNSSVLSAKRSPIGGVSHNLI